jgi:hypothetical protein
MDDSLVNRNELEIVVEFSLPLLENVFPKYLYADPEGSPTESTETHSSVSCYCNRDGVFGERWVQFELYPVNGLTQKFISDSWPNVQGPPVFVVLIRFEHLSAVPDQQSHHDPLSDQFAFLT